MGQRICSTFYFCRYSCFLVARKQMCCNVLSYGLRYLNRRNAMLENVWIGAKRRYWITREATAG